MKQHAICSASYKVEPNISPFKLQAKVVQSCGLPSFLAQRQFWPSQTLWVIWQVWNHFCENWRGKKGVYVLLPSTV